MAPKSEQLQIRVSSAEKAAIKRHARIAGLEVSTYVLLKALPPARERMERIVKALSRDARDRHALAHLNDLLGTLARAEFADALAHVDIAGLTPLIGNYVAAMVELAASRKGVNPPRWVGDVEPLAEPYFEGGLQRLRPYLIRVAPVAFRRRNIFVDATIGDRV